MTDRQRLRALVALALSCLGLVGALYVGAALTGTGQRVDHAAVRGRATHAAVQHVARGALDTVSLQSVALVGAGAVFLAVRRRRSRLAVGVAIAVAGANVMTQCVKLLLTRLDLEGFGPGHSASFPSGHATVAMSLSLALLLVAPRRWRLPVAVAGTGYAVIVGAGAVTAGWHRPSDIVGGYLVVTAWMAGLAAWLVARRLAVGGPARRGPWSLPPARRVRSAVVPTAVVACASLVASGALVAMAGHLRGAGTGAAFAGALFVIGASASMMHVAVLILAGRAPHFAYPPSCVAQGTEEGR